MSVRKGGQVIAEVADLSNYALNSNVVHQTGTDDNIQGTKRFKNTIYVDNSGGYYQKATNITSSTASPSSTQSAYPVIVMDNSGNQFAQLKTNITSSENQIQLMIRDKSNNWHSGLSCNTNGTSWYAACPTVGVTTNNDTIATTKFVRDLLGKTLGKTIPTVRRISKLQDIGSGNVELSESFLNYDFIFFYFGNDSAQYNTMYMYPTWQIDWLLSATISGYSCTLTHNGRNAYWIVCSYADGSTNTLFKLSTENGILHGVWGVKITGN